MTAHSRRSFLKYASAAAAYSAVATHTFSASATPLGLPLGLQLYSVRDMLPKDYEGTLAQLGKIGYQEVEAAGFYNHDANQVNAAMKNAGLHCVSAHYAWDTLHPQLDQIIEFGNKIGLSYIICAFPGFKNPAAAKDKSYAGRSRAFTLEDWRWNAEQFNTIGEKVHASGMHFGYHNHTMEFAEEGGVVPYDELLKLTDPTKVTMELDCGWVTVGGKNPIDYLKKYPNRFSMLHVKDFKELPTAGSSEAKPPTASVLGQGKIDYIPIFAAANKSAIKHIFVEQEQYDMEPMAELKANADYMKKFS